jgi:hypothetical protein
MRAPLPRARSREAGLIAEVDDNLLPPPPPAARLVEFRCPGSWRDSVFGTALIGKRRDYKGAGRFWDVVSRRPVHPLRGRRGDCGQERSVALPVVRGSQALSVSGNVVYRNPRAILSGWSMGGVHVNRVGTARRVCHAVSWTWGKVASVHLGGWLAPVAARRERDFLPGRRQHAERRCNQWRHVHVSGGCRRVAFCIAPAAMGATRFIPVRRLARRPALPRQHICRGTDVDVHHACCQLDGPPGEVVFATSYAGIVPCRLLRWEAS